MYQQSPRDASRAAPSAKTQRVLSFFPLFRNGGPTTGVPMCGLRTEEPPRTYAACESKRPAASWRDEGGECGPGFSEWPAAVGGWTGAPVRNNGAIGGWAGGETFRIGRYAESGIGSLGSLGDRDPTRTVMTPAGAPAAVGSERSQGPSFQTSRNGGGTRGLRGDTRGSRVGTLSSRLWIRTGDDGQRLPIPTPVIDSSSPTF